MKRYSDKFKIYLEDLSQPTPQPGGGSVASLCFCVGTSLIEMVLKFSKGNFKDFFSILKKERKKILPLIDLDGKLFSQIIKERSLQKKKYLISKSQKNLIKIGEKSLEILSMIKKVKNRVKLSLKGDLEIGLRLVELALFACIKNLQANQIMFKVDNRETINNLSKKFKKVSIWEKF
ncbi:MAG: hypothetical protein DRP68_00765 [Candidatus Omnitrophota bacterium]|nr:MAG: hypothetical protein DRP68_00765 [Candidatus Omnitrophota bacterium]RKY39017.1 MAG: hypothetical protein DRP72_00705 [Candidatus Omnitrophota bacterium]RKY46477.1 MAG: hypothetical protein DRP81_00370 [Candidatus Omnitrophota bacterium]